MRGAGERATLGVLVEGRAAQPGELGHDLSDHSEIRVGKFSWHCSIHPLALNGLGAGEIAHRLKNALPDRVTVTVAIGQ